MQGFTKREFSFRIKGREVSHDIYERGTGAPIVVIQELPGIGPETLRLADKLENSGFSVVLPHLFGPLGKISMLGNIARVFCMRREFRLFEKQATSPVVEWLGALCRDVRDRQNVPGVGVIGMCLTGNFAISLMADDSVLGAVASQPSLPLQDQNALHMSADDRVRVSQRLDERGAMHAFRFAGDKLCRAEKFAAIDAAFNGDGKTRVNLHTLPGKGHSVFTLDFSDDAGHPTQAAFATVVDYFNKALH